MWNSGSINKGGYGRMNIGQIIFLANRLALIFSGIVVKDNDLVLHSKQCVINAEKFFNDGTKSRLCCNPNHLRIGTSFENAQDTKELGRTKGLLTKDDAKWGEENKSSKLSGEDVINIRLDNRKHVEIAKDYNVASSTITRIKNNKRRSRG